ncbi:MAG: helix-turn-helix transcriptional regulator [Firmicutes bacterium]|nr:helix-turn-helix transcriptional regulator [Bacillota bacterium]
MNTTTNPVNLNKLKAKIVETDTKKSDLAAALGVNVQALNRMLAGRTKMKVETVPVFCTVLGLTMDEREDIFFSSAK